MQHSDMTCDVLVVGAGLGGVAAALSAGRAGADVLLAGADDWLGGQLTAQGVCTPDENAWVETGGATASYKTLRGLLRQHYSTRYALSALGRAQAHLNIGGCWVSRIAAEPRVGQCILQQMLEALPTIRRAVHLRPVGAEVDGPRITVANFLGPDGPVAIRAAVVIDATELGDLLPLCGAEWVVGAEARGETGEPDAPDAPHPDWVQPFTFPFALELRPRGEDHTVAPPADYADLRETQQYHVLDGAMRGMFGDLSWWSYRRVIDAASFDDPAYAYDVAMVNTGSNDYLGGIVPGVSAEADRATLARARRASLGYVHWLQTECPRDDEPGVHGYPEFRLRADWFGTDDGIAPHPYIRESRRLRARVTVRQQDIVAADSSGNPVQPGPRAHPFADTCGIGHYWLDVHRGSSPEPARFMRTHPFQIPLGALIPVRVANLLAGCKNLGVTHLANGAYRLHPIEWNVGEAAGALAARCASSGLDPADVHADAGRLAEFQRDLLTQGVPLVWWGDLPPEHGAFVAAQALSLRGIWPLGDSLEFRPDDELTADESRELAVGVPAGVPLPPPGTLRGEAAAQLARACDGLDILR